MRGVGAAMGLLWAVSAAPGWAEARWAELGEPEAFALGMITVTGAQAPGIAIGAGSLSSEAILSFERQTLDQAAALIPGVTTSNSGGSRNERLLFVRGFDRFQVPLSIDGIRVYLPADNRLDFGRFLTGDIAEVQVAKGYVSVIDGPGALGGAINLVTRTPRDGWQAEARASLSFDRGLNAAGHSQFGYVGVRQGGFYAQVSGTHVERDFFTTAGGFVPTANQAAGRRDLSDNRDWRVNARVGYAPGDGTELAISYTRQEGSKNAPVETTVPLPVQRYWSWPEWNLEQIALFAAAPLGDTAKMQARVFRFKFDNLLRSFDTRAQTTQTLGRAFNSFYEDEATGGSLRLDVELSDRQALTLAGHVRRDEHVEFQQGFPSGFIEPRQTSLETTWSVAAEHVLRLAPAVNLRTGFGYDWRDLHKAEEFGVPPGGGAATVFGYPVRSGDAWNAQGQLEWLPDGDNRLALSVSSRARFPTLFDRFSSRFGGATSNPDLKAERATQIELAGRHQSGRVALEAAIYVADVRDAIFGVPALFYTCTASTGAPSVPVPGCEPQAVSQSRNVGKGTYWGAEGAVSADIAAGLRGGVSATFVKRDIRDPNLPAFRPVGVPDLSGFVWLDWQPLADVTVLPSLDIAGDRWVVNTAGTQWTRDGAHLLANLRLAWAPRPGLEVAASASNIFDRNYQLALGFPEAGRTFMLSVRAGY
ncbi:TonB-dependent receptor plug domain-containing protein [Polymorphobacter sp.]|uniref:TonB-dependent receptor plug domain-containing protein n=1 Tax=Polymorphobacter sp. TaxID=1909290 RepID=UPI003F6F0A74